MQPNTFQGENGGNGHADPTSETPLAMATSVHDLMMFSDDQSDAFRVFWGVPSTQEEAAFHQLRAAGGILVSGAFAKGATAWVAVRSVAGVATTTMYAPPDWHGKTVVAASSDLHSAPVTVDKCETGGIDCWRIDGLQPNELVILYPEGVQPTAEQLTLKMAKVRAFASWRLRGDTQILTSLPRASRRATLVASTGGGNTLAELAAASSASPPAQGGQGGVRTAR